MSLIINKELSITGKSESIWDHMSHQVPCSVNNCETGDVADNSYHLYKRDVEMIRDLGLDFYRFSLSWSRILPTGFPDVINEAGVKYYNNLINELLKNNIIPMVTIYHFDLPQNLQKLGGWTNPHIVDWFGDFSKIVFKLFGDRVKYWVTINEPYYICYEGYGADILAPQVNITGIAEYLCAKNVLVAHAKAYHIYDEEFRPTQGGKIFISINARWNEPDSEDHIEAANDANQFFIMQYAYPIFSKSGDFPPRIKRIIAAKSKEQGFLRSRLPEFTPKEIKYVQGTSDLYGLNHYSTQLIYRNKSVNGFYKIPSMYDDTGVLIYQLDKWQLSNSSITKVRYE
ncbi:myrosinase 1-like [Zerene cesonia]|uniref:myrosinase 1-like n=1 Tax=Zerene cesonia TaxID=33412 RepID=UPI0018E4F2A8|nr:myrosinase 1-like [Zerene cesonia]